MCVCEYWYVGLISNLLSETFISFYATFLIYSAMVSRVSLFDPGS